jgi:hypothetical protein
LLDWASCLPQQRMNSCHCSLFDRKSGISLGRGSVWRTWLLRRLLALLFFERQKKHLWYPCISAVRARRVAAAWKYNNTPFQQTHANPSTNPPTSPFVGHNNDSSPSCSIAFSNYARPGSRVGHRDGRHSHTCTHREADKTKKRATLLTNRRILIGFLIPTIWFVPRGETFAMTKRVLIVGCWRPLRPAPGGFRHCDE